MSHGQRDGIEPRIARRPPRLEAGGGRQENGGPGLAGILREAAATSRRGRAPARGQSNTESGKPSERPLSGVGANRRRKAKGGRMEDEPTAPLQGCFQQGRAAASRLVAPPKPFHRHVRGSALSLERGFLFRGSGGRVVARHGVRSREWRGVPLESRRYPRDTRHGRAPLHTHANVSSASNRPIGACLPRKRRS